MCERRHITPHRPTQLDQRQKCRIMFTALDPADIAAIQPGLVRQSLLRHTKLAPLGTDALSEDVEIRVHPPKSLER